MKIFTLTRYYTPNGTFGDFKSPGTLLWRSAENPWKDNVPNISCIPEGTYLCKKTKSNSHGIVFEVLNVPGRTLIYIHVGNNEDDVLGCIVLGTGFGFVKSKNGKIKKWSVTNSGQAFDEFMNHMANEDEFILNITQYRP